MLFRPAFAKINLALEVTAKRPDGYHDLDSVVASIDWHDLISMEVRPASKTAISLAVTGPAGADIAADSSNLAWKAAAELAQASGRDWEIQIGIDKRIPAGAGLGGGSTDAASVLRLGAELMSAHGVELTLVQLKQLAPALGSDVPVLMFPGTYRVGGRGEIVDCLPAAAACLVVVVLSHNATKAVFESVTRPASDGRSARIGKALLAGDAIDIADLGSALEEPAGCTYPEFATALAALRQQTDERWHVTGSGGAVFALAKNAQHAHDLAGSLRDQGFAARAVRTVG